MKRLIMVSALFLILGATINAQVIKTKKVIVSTKPVTASVAQKTVEATPQTDKKPRMVTKTMGVKRNQLFVTKKGNTKTK